MEIKLPSQAAHLVGTVSEAELVFIAFLHKLHTMYEDHKWFGMYKYDIYTIIGIVHIAESPHFAIKNLTNVVQMANTSEYKVDIRLKRWTGQEFTYELTNFRNIIVWSMLLDHRTYGEDSKNTYKNKIYWNNAHSSKRNLVAAIKYKHYEYDCNPIRK